MYLEVGINRDTGNDEGSIPLILAMNSYNWSLARSLLDAGAKINARGNTGYTVLHEQARLDGYKSIYFCWIQEQTRIYMMIKGEQHLYLRHVQVIIVLSDVCWITGAAPFLEDHAGLKAKDYAASVGNNKIDCKRMIKWAR